MPLRKFAADFADRSLAYATGAALQDLIDPPPAALTVFETDEANWRVEAFLVDDAERDLGAELAPHFAIPLPTFRSEEVPDLNWVAMSQAALPPVEAGRFVVHGSHDRNRIGRRPNAILIDAGEAFGTAHHATTLGCLLAIDRLARLGAHRNILDLGCGSGVLAIAASKALPRARIIATDMDAQSIEVATGNARNNGAAGRIRFAVARGLADPEVRRRAPYDLIVANILAGPLISMAPRIAHAVTQKGTLVLSGLLVYQAAEVIAAYRACGFALRRHDRIVGWSTLTLVRR